MMYALDQISITADDLQKLNVAPTEVHCTFLRIFFITELWGKSHSDCCQGLEEWHMACVLCITLI